MGCHGENISPVLKLERRPGRDQEFRAAGARSGRADRRRGLVALDRVQHPGHRRGADAGRGSRRGAPFPRARFKARPILEAPAGVARARRRDMASTTTNSRFVRAKVDKLAVPEGASASLIGYMANANALAKAQLTGLYGR